MSEILQSCLDLCVGLAQLLWGLVTLVLGTCGDVLYHLHVSAPRLEGLLVGVLLAWLMLRRDKHPLLRVLSAPLKLVLDILDLAWDQGVEVLGDLWGTARSWVAGSLAWCRNRLSSGYDWVMSKLGGLRDMLKKG
jgi:hypothetical protein